MEGPDDRFTRLRERPESGDIEDIRFLVDTADASRKTCAQLLAAATPGRIVGLRG